MCLGTPDTDLERYVFNPTFFHPHSHTETLAPHALSSGTHMSFVPCLDKNSESVSMEKTEDTESSDQISGNL